MTGKQSLQCEYFCAKGFLAEANSLVWDAVIKIVHGDSFVLSVHCNAIMHHSMFYFIYMFCNRCNWSFRQKRLVVHKNITA